jgi:hypothetical protein
VASVTAANILALIEIAIVHIFLHDLSSHYASCSTNLIGIVLNIGVCHILSVNASTAIDHGQLLRVEVLFAVSCKTSTIVRFLFIVLAVANTVEIW